MIIKVEEKGSTKAVSLIGRLDTDSAPQLEEAMKSLATGQTDLEMNFSQLEYITSAGLRILLSVHKKQKKAGKSLTIFNANKDVMDVFDITGFDETLDIRS